MKTLRKNILIALTAFGIAGAAVAQTAPAQPEQGRHGHAISAEQRAAFKAERQARRAEYQALSPEQRRAKISELRAQRAEVHAARQARLAEALKLTPAQQPVWQAFAASMTPPQKGDRAGQRLDKGQRAALTAPQRLERRINAQKQRTARLEVRLSALNSLYAALTPEQRKVFDEQKQGRRGGRRHGGHGNMMRG